jgi:hypothetical protein
VENAIVWKFLKKRKECGEALRRGRNGGKEERTKKVKNLVLGFWEREQGVMFCSVHGLQNSTSSLIWN